MSLFTIADLHLSFAENKPMNIFGENWENHDKKIKKDWQEKVQNKDIIVLPGDFSWSMHLENTKMDFEYLNNLPGKKILLKGNHDYWWTTVTNMKKFLSENNFANIDFLYNNSYRFENYVIAGTRGWQLNKSEIDEKMINRELIRLELSLKEAKKIKKESDELIVFMHYPPILKHMAEQNIPSKFIEIMKKYNVKKCIYGHLHAASHKEAVIGNFFGIEFMLVSADFLDFKLKKI